MLDTRVLYGIFGWHGKRLLDLLMIGLTRSADGYYYCLVALVLFLFSMEIAPNFLVAALIAYGIEVTVHGILKNKVKRNRPCATLPGIERLLVPPDEFSFPSGHTAAAFVMASLLSSFVPSLFFAVFAWSWLVGVSRIYLGLHYPTDVLAGAFLGVMSAKLGVAGEAIVFAQIAG
jgi:undecaprenyl-diphosphatase